MMNDRVVLLTTWSDEVEDGGPIWSFRGTGHEGTN